MWCWAGFCLSCYRPAKSQVSDRVLNISGLLFFFFFFPPQCADSFLCTRFCVANLNVWELRDLWWMSCGHHDIAGIYAQTAAVCLFFSPSHLSHTAVIFLRSLILLSAFSLLPLSYNRALLICPSVIYLSVEAYFCCWRGTKCHP